MTLKENLDVVAQYAGLVGGTTLFIFALHRWGEDQRWKRAQYLDSLLKLFHSDPLVKLAFQVLDWTCRKVQHDGAELEWNDAIVREALANHADVDSFVPPRDKIRDAIDSLLNFFERLETAIASNLVEQKTAVDYFSYWLERLSKMDRYSQGTDELMRLYIDRYADKRLITSLINRYSGS